MSIVLPFYPPWNEDGPCHPGESSPSPLRKNTAGVDLCLTRETLPFSCTILRQALEMMDRKRDWKTPTEGGVAYHRDPPLQGKNTVIPT